MQASPNRLLKKCHCERFSAKQSLKIKGLLRQKAPRNDKSGVFQHPAKKVHAMKRFQHAPELHYRQGK
jgi:hypothetical protein